MGIFGPTKKEQAQAHQEWLRSGEIVPVERWARHRTGRILETVEVAASATVVAGRDPATVDAAKAGERAAIGIVTAAKMVCERLKLPWDDCLVVLERSDITMELFSDYLTHHGAAGIAAHDKIAELVSKNAVDSVARLIREGQCDFDHPPARGPVPGAGPAPAGRLDAVLGAGLLDCGLEQMSPGVYRGTVDSPRCAGRRHNVFVVIADGEEPTVMTPVVLIENSLEADVNRARDPGDGCRVSTSASYRILIRPFRIDPHAPDLGAVLAAATAMAEYGDLVQERLSGPVPVATQSLAKGQNVPLAANNLDVRVQWRGAPPGVTVDCSGLLLTGGGRVRGDHDFVFYNQPRHGRSSVHYQPERVESGGSVGGLRLGLLSIEDDVDRVVVIASTGGAPLSTVAEIRLAVVDMDTGATVVSFDPPGIGSESALVMGEVYRRGGGWRLRAVGQGYATGLAGVATDFGVAVDG